MAATLFLAPAVGARGEELLQDTLKSMVVAFGALLAAAAYLLRPQAAPRRLQGHWLGAILILLLVYALGSMAWSHNYLAGVEAARWAVLALLFGLGLQVWRDARVVWLAWGVFGGGVVAALWAALQFWFSLDWFSQGPNPASTFVNRNFFAEFAVCTLPFGLWLLLERLRSGPGALVAMGLALITVAVMMTGTRSALAAMWLLYGALLPLAVWRWRAHWPLLQAPRIQVGLVLGVWALAVGLASAVPSQNHKVLQEGRGATAWERALVRTASIRPDDASLGVRMTMWRASLRMIAAHPMAGVGAGAWELEVPRFQTEASQLETDYYAHNEYLQLVAEYGVLGLAALLGVLGFLLHRLRRLWRQTRLTLRGELACAGSILMLGVVSLAGFPWRMAATGALMALCLSVMAVADAAERRARADPTDPAASGSQGDGDPVSLAWWLRLPLAGSCTFPDRLRLSLIVPLLGALMLTSAISERAMRAEFHLISAARLALSLTATGQANAPEHEERRQELIHHVREGVALNSHYRKITPMVADELARWGDWRNAVWIWESVLSSRPHIAGILANVGRGYLQLGDRPRARAMLERAQAAAPSAPGVRSLEILVVNAEGHTQRAWTLAKQALEANIIDADIVQYGFLLSVAGREFDQARRFIDRGIVEWPQAKVRGYMDLGRMYAGPAVDPSRALVAFQAAFRAAPPAQWPAMLQQVPEPLREGLREALRAPSAQMSANKG